MLECFQKQNKGFFLLTHWGQQAQRFWGSSEGREGGQPRLARGMWKLAGIGSLLPAGQNLGGQPPGMSNLQVLVPAPALTPEWLVSSMVPHRVNNAICSTRGVMLLSYLSDVWNAIA